MEITRTVTEGYDTFCFRDKLNLINAMKTVKTVNGKLVLLALPSSIYAVFSKTNLLGFFVIAPDSANLKSVLEGD